MENNTQNPDISKAEKRKPKAYDIKRFNGALLAIIETNLITEEEESAMTKIWSKVIDRYIKSTV